MEIEARNLLDEALGTLKGGMVVVQDSVQTSASFVLHHLLKRSLSLHSSDVVVFLAFSHPFSHYDRILRKLGCNLAVQRDKNRFFFFDMLMTEIADGDGEKTSGDGLVALYGKIQKVLSALPQELKKSVTIMIDDVSLMEVAAKCSTDHVLDFVHYCRALTSEIGCSLVVLDHEDIYLGTERPTFILQLEYLATVLIKAEPLATGLATDVHGQLTVLNRDVYDGQGIYRKKICNFQFKVKESSIEYFYPGSRT
ncbi:elongator complex protein 6 [Ziziphus jujuba]|uniref:Elongator complex protein 6 n=1 Tax=Ziziphus jujuba TaxID=326968 RepID=A0A6P6FYP5_ZIZJJ|nr:elongator complex protein 6 [Ziziphus jujuba]